MTPSFHGREHELPLDGPGERGLAGRGIERMDARQYLLALVGLLKGQQRVEVLGKGATHGQARIADARRIIG